MAYASTDYRLTIRGDLPGGEVWANTWAFAGSGDVQDAVDDFNVLYTSWAGVCSNKWKATGASVKELGAGGDTTEYAWDVITGESASAPLPTECAVRVTVNSAGRHGGPFLCGMHVGTLDSNGQVDPVDLVGFLDALDTLGNTALPGHNFVLSLDSASTSTLYVATRIRVGHIFDVIRRRRNKLSEAYSIVDL